MALNILQVWQATEKAQWKGTLIHPINRRWYFRLYPGKVVHFSHAWFCTWETSFLHAKPWIPGGEILIFTAVIHQWRSPLRQFARARTINEYDVTMPVSYICVTSQINCGDVTILNRKRLSLATMAKSVIDDCFSRIVCSGHQIACKK